MIRKSNSFYILLSIDLFFILICIACRESTLTSSVTTLAADKKSGGVVVFEKSFFENDKLFLPNSKSIEIISREETNRKTYIYFRSTGIPGKALFFTKNGLNLELSFYSAIVDADGDGFPDVSELGKEDSDRFRQWFVRIAESQYIKPNSYWNPKERDCAGLIRYSYREALKRHDGDWFNQSGISLDKNLPDIDAFQYPMIPILGENIFKINKGSALDKQSFGTFADAETLFRLNTFFISKNIVEAKRGDLLFFENQGEIHFPFHSMIVSETSGKDPIVIYHVGEGDILKRVPISYLDKSKIFRVSPENAHFLGIYRFYILE